MIKEVKWNYLIKPYFSKMDEIEIVDATVDLIKRGLEHSIDDPHGDYIFFVNETDVPLNLLQEAIEQYSFEDQEEYEKDGFKFILIHTDDDYVEPDLPDNYPEEEPEY